MLQQLWRNSFDSSVEGCFSLTLESDSLSVPLPQPKVPETQFSVRIVIGIALSTYGVLCVYIYFINYKTKKPKERE